ncbi:hypothetical protein RI129_000546 [Pyrocoelia pectoralis]|uniref:Endonuclease/exonuclease/phosphatase domain-containing protein n=1 Tax=Pyrocoelia pectoralis TaxID=417401 RepID=A0AAN7ZQU4_9COLE
MCNSYGFRDPHTNSEKKLTLYFRLQRKNKKRASKMRRWNPSAKIDNEYVHICSVYAPDITNVREERRRFYEKLQNETYKILLLMGDFNSRNGNDIVQGVKQRFHEDINNDNGDLLVCVQNSLRINNTFFDNDFKYKYTFKNAQG